MGFENIVLELALIFAGSALIGTLFNILKQPIILAYIFFGILAGPGVFGLISSPGHIEEISHFGIILLLFLLGLDLEPAKLMKIFGKTSLITISTGLLFAVISGSIFFSFGYTLMESVIGGLALMFSSTVISVKLITVNVLHHKKMGELMIGMLLIQDIIAILVILGIGGQSRGGFFTSSLLLLGKTLLLTIGAFLFVKYIIVPLLRRFDKIQEYIFILSLGWCLSVAAAAHFLNLSWEIGAFIAGVSLASCPIALYIVDRLKPLRNFFLVLFFFAVGAQYDMLIQWTVILPGLIVALLLLGIKPLAYDISFRIAGEDKAFSKELGIRMGQCSEFALLVTYTAGKAGLLSPEIVSIIQFVTITTFIVSTWVVVKKYRTPINAL